MNFDLRYPLGMIFSLFGLLLTGYGLVGGPELREKSLGLNLDLGWGLVVLAFGVLMLFLAIRAGRRPPGGR